jgi:hypothetical protein
VPCAARIVVQRGVEPSKSRKRKVTTIGPLESLRASPDFTVFLPSFRPGAMSAAKRAHQHILPRIEARIPGGAGVVYDGDSRIASDF